MATLYPSTTVRLADELNPVVGIGLGVFVFFVVAWLFVGFVSVTARSIKQWWREPAARDAARPPRNYGFPVIAPAALPVRGEEDGPGRYRIVGVVRQTGVDIKMHLEAATLANAKVKAELKGVVVTQIDKEPERVADR